MSRDKFMGYGRTVINWKLSNFTKELLNTTTVPNLPSFESPEFQVELSNYERTKWKFIAHRNMTQLTLYMKRLEQDGVFRDNSGDYIVTYEMQIKDQHWSCGSIKRAKGKATFSGRIYYWHEERLGKIINGRESTASMGRRIIHNGTIHIVVYLEVIKKETDLSLLLNTTLSSHYEKLFNNENNDDNNKEKSENEKKEAYSDFIITSPDGKDIFVHKNILCTRSPVFEAMINSSMIEGSEKKVLITDIEGRVLLELIRFIYCGKVNGIDSIASELLYAANKYDIKDLKPLCIQSLALNLSLENVLDTIILADLHQENKLKEFCMDFIKWKYNDLKESEAWKNVNVQVFKEMLDFILSPRGGKKDECTIISNIKRTANTAPTAR